MPRQKPEVNRNKTGSKPEDGRPEGAQLPWTLDICWKDILLAYRAEKIRDWNRHWHAIRRAMTVEHSYRGMNTLIKACTSGTLRSRPVTKDIGYAKTMMDKIETRTKWLNANGRARQLEKHQRAIQQHKNAPEDSHTSSLMRR